MTGRDVRARYRRAPFRESASPLTISHTIRPNDWHRASLSLSSRPDTAFEEKHAAARFCIPPARWTRNRAASHGEQGARGRKEKIKRKREGDGERGDGLPSSRRDGDHITHTRKRGGGKHEHHLLPRHPTTLPSAPSVFHVFFLHVSNVVV